MIWKFAIATDLYTILSCITTASDPAALNTKDLSLCGCHKGKSL